MVETLFIRLSEPYEWIINDGISFGETRVGSAADLIACLAEINWRGRTIVVVPGEQVLMTSATVPSRQQRQIVQAVPYLIEEELASDVDDCHFAYGGRDEEGDVSVAVVGLEVMRDWQTQIESLGLIPEIMAADSLLGKFSGGASITIDTERAHIRTGKRAAFTVGVTQLAFAAELLPELTEVALCGSPAQLAELQLQITQIEALDGVSTTSTAGEERDFALVCRDFDADVLNLLQGEFQTSQESTGAHQGWRSAAALAACTFLLHVGLLLAQGIYLELSAGKYEQETRHLYAEVFPNDRNVRDVRRRWDAHLGGGGRSAGGEFLTMFRDAAANLPGSNLTVNNINYNESRGDIILQLTAARSELLVRFSETLKKTGLNAEIGTISQEEDSVRGSVKIRSLGGA